MQRFKDIAQYYRGIKVIKKLLWQQLSQRRELELHSCVRFIMCINVLDHAFGVNKILENDYKYLTGNEEYLLSADLHKKISLLHTQLLNRGKLENLLEQINLRLLWIFEGLRTIGSGYERSLGGEASIDVLTK